jgi:DNA helicase-2/ATP-dependent DNA helicase PcrA
MAIFTATMSTFQEAYTKLNANQKNAVDAIEGCVMVVAGPGTGKTQVLGARVAKILQETDVKPNNILCLTFTDAATVALRNRLNQFIGAEAYRVGIYTYHAFCNMVIQENKDVFGIQDLEPLSELEEAELLKEIIDELPNTSPLKRFGYDEYYERRNLKQVFDFMDKEDYSLERLQLEVERVLLENVNDEKNYYVRNGRNYKKGDFKQKQYDELKAALDKLLEAASYKAVYDTKKLDRGRYSYNDMINWVVEKFTTNTNLLANYQEQYQYVLVDEYQDTNGIQNHLLQLLISYWDNPNVFVVGDDDQSIYKFQGANVENILNFYKKYEEYAQLIVLQENYRSSQSILDGSNYVVSKNLERLVGRIPSLDKNIVAANAEVSHLPNGIKQVEYNSLYDEAYGITQKIQELLKADVPGNEIAVLYAKHAQAEVLMSQLQHAAIDYNVTRSQNVLETKIIQQLLLYLHYFQLEFEKYQSGDHLVFEILHFNNFRNVSSLDLAKLSVLVRQENKNDKKKGWRAVLNQDLQQLSVAHETRKELQQFVNDLEYWLKEYQNLTLQQLIEQIMGKLGFISRAMLSNDAAFQMQCLTAFFNFVKAETGRNPKGNLKDLLKTLEIMENFKISIPVMQVVKNQKGINLMTAHGSKGLEFDYIFLMGCDSKSWDGKRQSLPFKLSSILPSEGEDAITEERRRLFYVALTRARKQIEISYARLKEDGKEQTKSQFIAELEGGVAIELQKPTYQQEDVLRTMAFSLTGATKPFMDLSKQDFMDDVLDRFVLNATNLNAYLRCPVSFFYQHILRIPSAKSSSATFGSSIHSALEGVFKHPELFGAKEDCVAYLHHRFESYMANNQETFTPESYERKLFYGKEILEKYYDEYAVEWSNGEQVEVEVFVNKAEVDGVPIKGRLDKLIHKDGAYHVVDYKTGNSTNGIKKTKSPVSLQESEEEQDYTKKFGGDYWRQLYFYKALLENDPQYGKPVISGEIDFVEPKNDAFKRVKIMLRDDEYAFVREQISSVYGKIKNKEFSNGCNDENCQWCNFNKYYMKQELHKSSDLLVADPDVDMEEL